MVPPTCTSWRVVTGRAGRAGSELDDVEPGDVGLGDGAVAVVELAVVGSAAGSDEDEQAPPTRAPSARATRSSEGRARVVTVSDGVAAGVREDRGGPAVVAALEAAGARVDPVVVVGDGVEDVARVLREVCAGFAGLVVTTGGTGFGPRDLTPEATRHVIDREAPGLAEAMRAVNPLGRLSRGVAGTVDRALVVNVPGSPGGAVECLGAVVDVVPHALRLLEGDTAH